MISLKAYIPTLAYLLNLSPAALYERQRVLVRKGILSGSAGHGPGTGVTATPSSVAWLVITAMATDSLSEMESGSVTKLSAAQSQVGTCPLTAKKTFGQALTGIFLDTETAARVSSIQVDRSAAQATIYFRKKGRERLEFSRFGSDPDNSTLYLLKITASLPSEAVCGIARDLKLISAGAKASLFREELNATVRMRKSSKAEAEGRAKIFRER